MKVLFVGSESHPFIKTGGLGDVIGALPESLKDLGLDARVVIPNYRDIKTYLKEKFNYLGYFFVKVGWRNQYCGVLEYKYKGVTFYFLDNEYYFNRDGLYGYYDDGERFAFFSRAVMEFLKFIDWTPEILHCNDWQTAMVPVLHKLEYINEDKLKNIKSVFSIHNLFFKGMYGPEVLSELFGYNLELFFNKSLEHNGAISFLKGGINYSDIVTTVSTTYAEEIKTSQYGEQLDGLLKYREKCLVGILNGINYNEYNPENDAYIGFNYRYDSLENKYLNKESLQKELGLEVDKSIPMIGLVSRLTHQKGCDLIIQILDELMNENLQIVILGTGDYMYEQSFRYFEEKYKNKISANIKFSDELAHKIYASSDMFLMPSLFEPCGLGQLIALRYGSIPIVRETGGLKDTVYPYNEFDETGNGFGFKSYSSHELLNTIKYAVYIFNNKSKWEKIVNNAMLSDNSWEKSAKEYIEVYRELINEINYEN